MCAVGLAIKGNVEIAYRVHFEAEAPAAS